MEHTVRQPIIIALRNEASETDMVGKKMFVSVKDRRLAGCHYCLKRKVKDNKYGQGNRYGIRVRLA